MKVTPAKAWRGTRTSIEVQLYVAPLSLSPKGWKIKYALHLPRTSIAPPDVTIMSTEQHSDSAPEQDSDSEQDSQFSNLSSNTNVTKILIGKINKFDLRLDYTLFYGDFSKFLSCAGWAGK